MFKAFSNFFSNDDKGKKDKKHLPENPNYKKKNPYSDASAPSLSRANSYSRILPEDIEMSNHSTKSVRYTIQSSSSNSKYRIENNNPPPPPPKETRVTRDKTVDDYPDKTIVGKNGNSLLHKFVNDYDSLYRLLKTNAKKHINLLNKKGESPLHLVRNTKCCKLLIDNGANKENMDRNTYCGGTPIFTQHDYATLTYMFTLYNPPNVKERGGNGRLAIHDSENPKCVQFLTSKGLSVTDTDLSDNTPLHMVKNIQCCNLYISMGASVDAKNKDGNTSMHTCFYPDCLEAMLKVTRNINSKNNLGRTILFEKIEDRVMLRLVIQYGIDKAITDNNGKNAFDCCNDKIIKAIYLSLNSQANRFTYEMIDAIDNEGKYFIDNINRTAKQSPYIDNIVKIKHTCINCRLEVGDTLNNPIVKTTCSFDCEFNTYCLPCITRLVSGCQGCKTCKKPLSWNNIKIIDETDKKKPDIKGDLLNYDEETRRPSNPSLFNRNNRISAFD